MERRKSRSTARTCRFCRPRFVLRLLRSKVIFAASLTVYRNNLTAICPEIAEKTPERNPTRATRIGSVATPKMCVRTLRRLSPTRENGNAIAIYRHRENSMGNPSCVSREIADSNLLDNSIYLTKAKLFEKEKVIKCMYICCRHEDFIAFKLNKKLIFATNKNDGFLLRYSS